MKKKILIIVVLFFTLTAGALTYTYLYKFKVPTVSENPNIPHFIDTMMKNERMKIINVLDTNSTEYRLNKLGFSAKSEITSDFHTVIAIKKLYEVYDSLYPNYQFINFKGVKKLLDTFDLYIGSTNLFICNIPTKNIIEMEKFKPSFLYDRGNLYGLDDLDYKFDELGEWNDGYGVIGGYVTNTYDKITQGNGTLSNETDLIKYSQLDFKTRTPEIKQFLIIAPKSCFKGEINENGNFGTIKDPIVLAPVEGGYIIVTAW